MTTIHILEMCINILLLNKKLCYNYYDSEMINMDYEDNEKIDEDFISYDVLSDQEIIEQYHEAEAFLKIVDEEIKKTDVGDSSE